MKIFSRLGDTGTKVSIQPVTRASADGSVLTPIYSTDGQVRYVSTPTYALPPAPATAVSKPVSAPMPAPTVTTQNVSASSSSGWAIDPATGWPIDPATGMLLNPGTGQEVPIGSQTGPQSGTQVASDGAAGVGSVPGWAWLVLIAAGLYAAS